ncbi:hypothetical protein FNF29_00095 [Cafeteria roenbergensis]|uniref:J domain-containing protein n=1 Tax=Cafeteria roenbergensis TaxID=33653 RepID=A0A5A8CXV0_CAFRO|nr:hypothetical protein FNF29_00095 [Cafeteria roenbergensis]|eukprot:KAA0157519.1 hypothetical protein FNF29_00095 [Cafeteria roenbergensis]
MPGGGTSIKHRSTDPYRVLGLEPGCSEVEAKRAYLQLAKQFHPDVCQAPDAADRFRNVTDAYDAVSLRLKSSSVGRPGGGGHGGYDAERMAARVREFRQRAEEMRASHKTRARAGARADAWLELQRRIGDRKFMLAIPIMLLWNIDGSDLNISNDELPGCEYSRSLIHLNCRDRLVNRSGTQSCAPCAVYAPTSLEEIQVLVRTAGETRQCIRVAGSLSAHNDSAMSKDMVISLERYDAVHMIDCDKAIIMVQAGIVLRKLYEKLASFDLGLKHCGPDADVTLAGALSVGHHASSTSLGMLSDSVRELQMVLASGQVVIASKRRNPELFKAALCGLGALGIITGVVLQCAPLRSLRRTSESQSLDVVLEQLPEIGSAAEYVAFDWVPLADRTQ